MSPTSELRAIPVGFVLSAKVLAHRPVRGARPRSTPRTRRRPPTAPADAAEALLRIFEIVVDRAADGLEHCGLGLRRAGARRFRERGGRAKRTVKLSAALRRIGDAADEISRIRDELLGLGRLAAYLMESGIAGAPALSAARSRRSAPTSLR